MSLATFCRGSVGAFSLLLCDATFAILFPYDTPIDVDYGTLIVHRWRTHDGDVVESACARGKPLEVAPYAEVAPLGVFQNAPYTTNIHEEKYGRAYQFGALIVVPQRFKLQLLFVFDPTRALEQWRRLVVRDASLAIDAAKAIAAAPQNWSLASPEGDAILAAVTQLGSLVALHSILSSCKTIAFQPKLRHVVAPFDWPAVVTIVTVACNACAIESRMNLVASVLDGVTAAGRISLLLGSVNLKPRNSSHAPPSPNALARVLAALAHCMSVDRLRMLVHTTDAKDLVYVVAPALQRFLQRLAPVVRQSDVAVLAQDTLAQLKVCVAKEFHAVFVRARIACPNSYSWEISPCTGCAVCEKFARFVASAATSATFRAYKLQHIDECLRRSRLADCITIARPPNTIDGRVVVTKTPTRALYTCGDHQARMLNSLLMGLPS